jgi:hypothetical protein
MQSLNCKLGEHAIVRVKTNSFRVEPSARRPARYRGCAKTRIQPRVYRLLRFVLVRVIWWIILFGRVKRTIHEITRTNTNKNTQGNRVLSQPLPLAVVSPMLLDADSIRAFEAKPGVSKLCKFNFSICNLQFLTPLRNRMFIS